MKIQLSEHFTYKKLIRFTIPTIAMMIFTSIYGVVDGIFVSNCVGADAFAAVNLIMPALMITGAVGFMFGTGGSALVSKTIGEGDKEKANRYFSMIIYLLIGIGAVLTVLGIILIKPVSIMLGAKGNILKDCITYGTTILVFLVPYLLMNCFQSFFIVAERPKMGLAMSIVSGISNMILDFVFVYIFPFGVCGAAIATGISQTLGGIIPLIYFARKNKTPLKLGKTKLEIKPILKTCTNGSSEMVTNLSMSLVNMLYNMQLMKYAGSSGVVAYGIIMYVGFIFVGNYLGYSVGMAPIVSYHYGAKDTDELKNLFKKSIKLLVVTSLVMTVLAELSAEILAGIFVSYDQNLLEMTTIAIRIYAISYLITGINIFGSAFFTALNDGVVSAVISFLRAFVMQVITILVMPKIFGLNGIWSSIIVAEILSFIVTIIAFIINRKKYKYI